MFKHLVGQLPVNHAVQISHTHHPSSFLVFSSFPFVRSATGEITSLWVEPMHSSDQDSLSLFPWSYSWASSLEICSWKES